MGDCNCDIATDSRQLFRFGVVVFADFEILPSEDPGMPRRASDAASADDEEKWGTVMQNLRLPFAC